MLNHDEQPARVGDIMTRLQAIFAGILTGLIGLGVLAFMGWHHVSAILASPTEDFSRKWSVSGLDARGERTVSSDVWMWPESPLIEPGFIQRVEWQEGALVGRDAWGYYLYYRARVKDEALSKLLREMVTEELKPLPAWATHQPSWWSPQKSVPRGRLTEVDLQSDDIFMEIVGTDVFLYWIRDPYEGHI